MWLEKLVAWLLKPYTDCLIKEEEPEETKLITLEEHNALEKKKRQGILISKSTGRPVVFKDYIGQTKAKTLLKAYIAGTKKRGRVFPHTLIYGNAGCGKTTLARIIANVLKQDYTEILSRSISNTEEIVDKIRELEPRGILFIDEIHGLSRETVEAIYPILEDMTIDGEDKKFTLIGATTEIGEIIKDRRPFYDRFKIKQELESYKISEIGKIVKNYKTRSFADEELDTTIYNTIAHNSRGIPRVAISQLESTIYLGGNIKTMLDSYGILVDGYTTKDLMILKYVQNLPSGVGIQSILSFLNTSSENYMYDIEPYLIQNELLVRTSKGRRITEKGCKLVKKLELEKKLRKL